MQFQAELCYYSVDVIEYIGLYAFEIYELRRVRESVDFKRYPGLPRLKLPHEQRHVLIEPGVVF